MKEKFYITTAIAYTSGKPHIGNTYEAIFTDAVARFKRLQGKDVFFMTGTDEHGLKVEQKAADKGVSPKQFVDDVAGVIKGIWDKMNVSYDKFMRTTDADHVKCVQKIFKKFYEQGDIYKSSYEGLYCTPCESFWTESQLVNGKCPDCGRDVKPAKEEAYFFKMGKYADRLVRHIATHPDFIRPVSRKNEMLNNFLLADEFIGKSDEELLAACDNGTLKTKLQDLCVSRSTFKWGVPVDFDTKHVVYVWLDALANYITGIGYDPDGSSKQYKKLWPADVHVLGKDVLRFHIIYWPIFLMALGEELPKCVYGHAWLLQGSDKMSKSKGNVIYADELADKVGVDTVRYFVLHEMPYADDGNVTLELVCERNNSDLANVLGNLVKRTVSMTNQYLGGTAKKTGVEGDTDEDFEAVITQTYEKVASKMDELKVADALDALWSLFRRANKYIDETTPWVLAKDENRRDRLSEVLYNLLISLDIGANLLHPFMPETAEKILAEIGGKERAVDSSACVKEYTVTKNPQTLFVRLKAEDIQSEPVKEEAEEVEIVEKEKITIDDFDKIELRVGKVIACEPVKKSKLLHETVKVGNKTLSILSGIAHHYTAEEMVGKKVIVVCNLPPREMKGILSEGMIVCAEAPDGTLSLVSPEKDVPDGSLFIVNYIDVHCHINDSDYGSVENLIENIQAAGVKKFISVGFDLPSSRYCRDLAEKYPCAYFTAGFHPTELKNYRDGDLEEIASLAAHPKCVAIGEIGLDYHYPDTDRQLQHKVFKAQLSLAEKLNMPVQIHSRDTAEDMLCILKERAPRLKVLLHCYSHSTEISTELEKLGVYFSFGGTSTYSGSKKAKRTIAALPLCRILTETDSPYLPPKSKYGVFPNTPESIPEIAKNIADIKGLSEEEVTGTVWNTAHDLFEKLKNR